MWDEIDGDVGEGKCVDGGAGVEGAMLELLGRLGEADVVEEASEVVSTQWRGEA